MTAPYYTDPYTTLYHGDCLEILEWLTADYLVTDPPYGRGWVPVPDSAVHHGGLGIAGDKDCQVRDAALAMFGNTKKAVVFGDFLAVPPSTRRVLTYLKSRDAGAYGAIGGFRRDTEAIFLLGRWPASVGGRSAVVATAVGSVARNSEKTGHAHTKPGDVMSLLIGLAPGIVADPFAGSGSTLVAAKAMGRRSVGVEIDERYCETAAKRLAQDVLDFGGAS